MIMKTNCELNNDDEEITDVQDIRRRQQSPFIKSLRTSAYTRDNCGLGPLWLNCSPKIK